MRRALITLGLLPLVAACADLIGDGGSGLPPDGALEASLPVTERSQESFEIEKFFSRVQDSLIARGLLRIDGGGPDVPFTDTTLARNFMALAFSQEFTGISGRLVRRSTENSLHRWVVPVKIEPLFGASVDPAQAAFDRKTINRLALRLETATEHPVNVVARGGNFHVLILNDQELRSSGPLLRGLIPEISAAEISYVEDMPRETYCVVFASDPAGNNTHESAVAVIRAELPERLRTSCIHEEVSQGLGLANDSPLARPSIFNDDDEFGRLTTHDELLLQMLYDSRLSPGMSDDEAASTVRRIATELLSPAT
ncbi:MAG: DUF2927 domain-containing protein [Boseongicola sp.]